MKWLRVTRAHFLGASLFPYVSAVAMAGILVREMVWLRVALGAGALVLIHLGANLWNDFWDERLGADARTHPPTTWSGGSRPTQRGLITPRQAVWGSILLLAVGSGVGIYLDVTATGHVIFWLGAAGVALAVGYSAPPVRLSRRGWGEAAVAVAFGPVVMLGAHWLVAGELSAGVAWVSAGAGLMTALVLLVNEFPDRSADRRAGKRTLVVRLGSKGAARLAWVLWTAAYAAPALAVWTGALPTEALLVLLTLPLAVTAGVVIETWRAQEPSGKLAGVSALQVVLQAVYVVGLGLSAVWGFG